MNRTITLMSVVALLFQPLLTLANADEGIRYGKRVALQGEDVDLPQDLISRLDDGKLRISLDTLGLPSIVDANRSSLIVRLIGEDDSNLQVAVDSSGTEEFDNVTPDKLHAVVINSPIVHAVIPVLPVSEKVADKKGIKNDILRVPLMQASAQEILKNVSSYTNSGSGQSIQPGTTYGPQQIGSSVAPVFSIRLTSEGALNGRVVVPESNLLSGLQFANITLTQYGTPISQTTSNETDGKFSLNNVLPGRYGLMAAGPAGYAAYAINVIAANQALANKSTAKGKLVAFNQASVGSAAIVVLVPPSLMPGVVNAIENDYARPVAGFDGTTGTPPSGPMASGPGGFPAGGGGPFGGGGGGGGLLGGGRLGGLALLGALGGIAAAIASNDDNNNNNPVLASPIGQ